MVTCFKRLTKALITFILVFCILFQSLYFKPEKVEANPGAAAIAGYIMSIVGAIDMGTGGGVRGIATSLKDALTQKVADLMGTGIYEDSNGNYIFSGTATQQIYETLLGSGAYNAIVCSNFPISQDFQPPTVPSNSNQWLAVNNAIVDYGSNALVFYGNNYNVGYGNTCTVNVYNISNVAFILLNWNSSSEQTFKFYDKNGNLVTCPYKSFRIGATNSSNTGNASIYRNMTYSGFSYSYSGEQGFNDSIKTLGSTQAMMMNFNYSFVGAKRSIIVASTINDGISKSTGNTGVTVNTFYQNIPSIKTTVLENNDWNNVYNNYVQNIQNESNTYIDNNTGEIDIDALRKEMQRQGSIIYDAVEQGVENIIEYVSVTNQWLEKIYNLLAEIESELQNGGGGSGGTVSGSTVDLSNIESYLQSLNTNISAMLQQCTYIANNLPNNEQQLTAIYTVLQNIYQSLQNIPGGGSPIDPNSDPYAPWYPKFFGIPDTDIIDTVEKIEIIEALLSGLVPLCYITGLGAVVNALGTQPVDPVFNIPLEFHNDYIDVDEDIEIDLTPFEDIRDIVAGGIVLCFMLALGYFTIWLLKFLLDILSKY